MLLSRFWYLILAATAAGAVAMAMLAQGIVNSQHVDGLNEQLRRDRVEIEAMLRLEARHRLDRIAFAAVDPQLGRPLRQFAVTKDRAQSLELHREVKDVLRAQVRKITEAAGGDGTASEISPDIAFALDAQGNIVAQLGPLEANPPGGSLSSFPLVRRALLGYVRDDVWLYDRHVYRMAARPVVFGGDYVGAVLHGYRLDERFAEMLSKKLGGGASIAFYWGPSVISSYSPPDIVGAPTQPELATPLQQVVQNERFLQGDRTQAYSLQGRAHAVYSRVTGSAADADVGYAIARPLTQLPTPFALIEGASQADVAALPFPLLGGGALLLFGIGMLAMYFECDVPLGRLRRKVDELPSSEEELLVITQWRGPYRKLADGINRAIEAGAERAGKQGPAPKKANLDELLGPVPENPSSPFFGFAHTAPEPQPAIAAAKPSGADVAAPVAAISGSSPRPGAPPPSPPPAPPALSHASTATGPTPAGASEAPHAEGSVSQPFTSTLAGAATVHDGASDEGDSHFREVYAEYLAVRRECGEQTSALTFEKFVITLRKNRDQIIAKHDAKAVRFTVYVKDGKAALKASPIKA